MMIGAEKFENVSERDPGWRRLESDTYTKKYLMQDRKLRVPHETGTAAGLWEGKGSPV